MPVPELHRDRERAESFGAAAEAYEALRPPFPDALLDELAALGPRDVLDLGCGTGKVARGLARRGIGVLGVELDPRMAAVARRHGVRVEVARFEDWADDGRRFELVTCGDAWHWIEPARGAAKVAHVLRPGGTFVWFWNLQMLDDAVLQALEPVYAQHAPEVYRYGSVPPAHDPAPHAGPFTQVAAKAYLWDRHVAGGEWAAFVETISDHRRLPRERLVALQHAIRDALEPFGTIRVRAATTAWFLRRA